MEKHETANHLYRPTIKGAAVGIKKQIDELLQLAITGKIKPLVEALDLSETGSVFEKLRRDGITGRGLAKFHNNFFYER